jgi:hypothetical protein
MKKLVGLIIFLSASITSFAQVDTTFIYNPNTPYGVLDIRIAEASNRYWYLQENVTFSFRESLPGVKTNTFVDMTSWDSSPYSQGNMRKRSGTTDQFQMNYRLLFPTNYNPNLAAGYPIIVMLHGAGERANCWDLTCYWSDRNWRPTTNTPAAPTTSNHQLLNNDHNLSHGGSPHLTARNLAGGLPPDDPALDPRAFPGFVLFPQNLNGWESVSSNDVIRLIRLVVKKYKVDPDRIYVHGLSNGGQGVYDVIKRAPWLFAAALPMSAVNEASLISRGLVPTVAHIPLWTFQGGQDINPTPAKTEGFVKTFKEAGMDVRYTLYPNLGHGTWNTAYAEPDFFTWMLAKNKSRVHVFFNNPKVCTTNGQGAKLGFAAGFLGYQWEKDGVIIPGATAFEYIATEPGVYRGRFARKANPSESDWNDWSQAVTVTDNTPAKAVIDVYGTHLMRGPDDNAYYNTVQLKSNTVNDKYFWYKNGVLVNIPNTSLDDTTRTYKQSGYGSIYNGTFTLVTRGFDNCPTPTSDPVYIYTNNSGPFMPVGNEPTSLNGSAINGGSTSISWNDNSSIETGYEVWRRKPGQIFYLAGRTGANETNFVDTNLEPSTSYDYKVRAVAAQARSNYGPSNSLTTNLVVTTQPDFVAPGPPSNLQVTGNSINSISLKWNAGSDDIKVRRYVITYGSSSVTTPTAATSFTLTGLPMNVAYNIRVRTEDFGGNFSTDSAPVVGSTYVTGLTYGHTTGAWTDLDQITNWSTPEFTGQVTNFTLNPRTQEDFFFFEFTGYLYIRNAGSYTFRLTSDEGSRLTLDNVMILDHDGLHSSSSKTSAAVTLSVGAHLINVRYFEYTGSQSLTVRYRGPDTGGGNSYSTIPNSALRSGANPPVVSASIAGEVYVVPEINGPEGIVSVNVYPNPVSSQDISIKVRSESAEPVNVGLMDMMGKTHYQNTFSSQEANEGTRISPASTLINGMYVVVVKQGKYTVKEKVIIRN